MNTAQTSGTKFRGFSLEAEQASLFYIKGDEFFMKNEYLTLKELLVIKENPETYPQKIVHATNIGRGAVLYHLDILLYAGMVACLKDGKLRKYRAAQKAVIDAGARWTIGGENLNSRAIM